ncbi:MAG: lipopolysaccharide heptosyltransferase II [Azoarcus sp.]|jgi:heptosyltransferase-2|nr:lipopolysaccharide heptosyltransferase II [Azoarcus sp.]
MRKILVVGPSWVGDMVMAQSLFMSLKPRGEQDGGLAIDVLAPSWSLPIIARMPQVRHGVAMPLGHGQLGLGARWRLGRELAREGYDQAIVLPGSFKSALVPFFAGIPQRTGFRGEVRYGLLNDMRPLDRALLPMTVQRFVALGQPRAAAPATPAFPVPRLAADAANQAALAARFGFELVRPVIAFMPGAEYGPAKQWPPAHYAELARALAARGLQIWVLGSGKDREAARPIAAATPEAIDFTGRTSLGDAIDLLALARAAVTNDSGLMHVAAALDVPLVAIFGSSSPEHTPPLGNRVAIESLRLACAPCFARHCPDGHTRCLTAIEPTRVLAALEPFIEGEKPPSRSASEE